MQFRNEESAWKFRKQQSAKLPWAVIMALKLLDSMQLVQIHVHSGLVYIMNWEPGKIQILLGSFSCVLMINPVWWYHVMHSAFLGQQKPAISLFSKTVPEMGYEMSGSSLTPPKSFWDVALPLEIQNYFEFHPQFWYWNVGSWLFRTLCVQVCTVNWNRFILVFRQ